VAREKKRVNVCEWVRLRMVLGKKRRGKEKKKKRFLSFQFR